MRPSGLVWQEGMGTALFAAGACETWCGDRKARGLFRKTQDHLDRSIEQGSRGRGDGGARWHLNTRFLV